MLFILIAALLWGCTGPFLKRYSKGFTKPSQDAKYSAWHDIRFLLSRPKYLITQALNLSGSAAFFYALREADVSVASVVTNSLAFVFTTFVSVVVLREGTIRPRTWLGMVLVLAGVSLCSISNVRQHAEAGVHAHDIALSK